MATSYSLQRLAQMLKLRRGSSLEPYQLLLTSAISFTPALFQSIGGLADWYAFRTYIQGYGHADRINILRNALRTTEHMEGYSSLARLIANGYFSTIMTTNLDTRLEEALGHEGLKQSDFQTLVVGRDTSEYIARSFNTQARGILIVKLHGSLNEDVLSSHFPDFFELHSDIRQNVKRYLNQDLIIVGSLIGEDDLIREFNRAESRSIYYVTPQFPGSEDAVVKIIEARKYDAKDFVIAGSHGTFNGFFRTLESMLLGNIPALSISNGSALEHSSANAISLLPEHHLYPAKFPLSSQTVNVFYVYAPEDEDLRRELEDQLGLLRQLGLIKEWHSGKISAGTEWESEIRKHWQQAQLILLLVSASFMASQTYEAAKEAMTRHQAKTALVIPIILRPVDWRGAVFDQLNVLPRNKKPITSWARRGEAMLDVAQGIREVIESIHVHHFPS